MRPTNYVDELINFLLKRDEASAREMLGNLERSGVAEVRKYGPSDTHRAAGDAETRNTHTPEIRRALALIELGSRALDRVTSSIPEVQGIVRRRISRGKLLRLVATILTTFLTSSVVVSLNLSPQSSLGTGLGILAIVASILVLAADRLDGGQTRLVEEFVAVSLKFSEAVGLTDRLKVYATAPELFSDIESRVSEAVGLVAYLDAARERWGVM